MSESRENRETLTTEARPKRIPVGEARDVTTLAGRDPGRVYRWVVDGDNGERLQKFLDAGYRFETDKSNLRIGTKTVSTGSGDGSKLSMYAGKDTEGNKIYQYVMSIAKEWYDEDQALKAAKIDEIEEGMDVPSDADYGSIKMDGVNRTVNLKK